MTRTAPQTEQEKYGLNCGYWEFTTGDAVQYRNGFGSGIDYTVYSCTHVDGYPAYLLLVNGREVPGYVAMAKNLVRKEVKA